MGYIDLPYKRFKFVYAYNLAAYIRGLFYEKSEEEYLTDHFDPDNDDFQRKIIKPCKNTLLHDVIGYYWNFWNETLYYKGDSYDNIRYFEEMIELYDAPFISFAPVEKDKYVSLLYDEIKKLNEYIVNETFTILFNDRVFLLDFNTVIAEVVSDMEKVKYPNILKDDGIIKRARYIPVWLKKAIYYRDKARCQICGKDLSGLQFFGEEIHYDHIIPLYLGGTNDPTNFQILCKHHNLGKGGHQIVTSDRYQAFW